MLAVLLRFAIWTLLRTSSMLSISGVRRISTTSAAMLTVVMLVVRMATGQVKGELLDGSDECLDCADLRNILKSILECNDKLRFDYLLRDERREVALHCRLDLLSFTMRSLERLQ